MNKLIDRWIRRLLMAAACASLVIVVLIFLFLGRESLPFLHSPGASDLFALRWAPVSFQHPTFGLVPLFTGSLVVSILGIVFAIPFGVTSALYLAELARDREREWVKPLIELLAGVPSVVIGFFGLVVIAPVVKKVFGLPSGLTAITGATVLGLMSLPTIISLSEDAIRSVPKHYREASLALGATRLQTLFLVVFPAALPGIVAAIMLGVGRVMGETMAVLMVTGNAPIVSASPFDSVRTMTATIAAEMGEVAKESDHYRALFCIGVVLLIFTWVLNYIAQRVLRAHRQPSS